MLKLVLIADGSGGLSGRSCLSAITRHRKARTSVSWATIPRLLLRLSQSSTASSISFWTLVRRGQVKSEA